MFSRCHAMLLRGGVGWLLLVGTALGRPADREVILDHGLLRWKDTGEEIALFGVNYYPPFHWNYADLKAIGADHEQTIRADLAHFKRLRLDLLRLHVFDREISNRQGNLLDNDHLRLLDYLIEQAKGQGIYLVLTPIAWWGVPGRSDGFSDAYPMPRMTTDPAAWAAQGRYLKQFLRHTNRYTGLSYAEDPAIAAIELINEPQYPPDITDATITEYINTLGQSVRASGSHKPVFYNGWGGHLAAVGRSTNVREIKPL
jgi:endo-1,4-beta-mannosidase